MDSILVDFDNHFPNGIYTEPSKGIPMYNFKKLKEYCKKKGVEVSELTEKELLKFQVSDNNDSTKPKKQTTIKVDSDTVVYFKSMAKKNGMPYQALINQYLTECVINNRELHMANPK